MYSFWNAICDMRQDINWKFYISYWSKRKVNKIETNQIYEWKVEIVILFFFLFVVNFNIPSMPMHLRVNSMKRIGKFFGIHLRIREFHTINQYYHFSNCASTDFIIGFFQFNIGVIENKTFPSDISHFRYIVAGANKRKNQ